MRPAFRLVLPASLLAAAAFAVPVRGQSAPRADTSARPMEPVPRAPAGPVAGTRPTYPPLLRSAGWEGTVVAELTVDTTGAVVPDSFRVLQSSHELFTVAARKVIATWRFEPATVVDSAAGSPRMRSAASPTRFTISYRLVPDSAAVGPCQAVAPVSRVCAPRQTVIRTWLHD